MQLDRLARRTGEVTVTATVPGDARTRRESTSPTVLRNLLAEATAEIEEASDLERDERAALLAAIADAEDAADRLPLRHGLWLSITLDETVRVPLAPEVEVTGQVVVADRPTLLRPLLEHEQRALELLVLTLSETTTDLAVLDVATRELTPVGDPFPHDHPRGTTGAQSRRDGSRHRDARHRGFWRTVANDTHAFVRDLDLPVVTVGVERSQSFLRELSAWPDELTLPVVASPDGMLPDELTERVLAAAEGEHARRAAEVEELVATRAAQDRVVRGLTDVDAAAAAGRVELLVIGSGPPVPGYRTESGHLVTDDPGSGTPVPDVQAEAMEAVVVQGGQLALVDDDREPVATLRW
jgi:hypothetical protein